ncbi:L-lactate dehydrogenase (cytochrome) [Cladophialophora psammophila CBS 110553]|uniref:L-lactate dehydrogenase (cytochrome) n=1 Tax=Cladophialophora psammophila CBS 110553 TaxID=1182543 RepID=W9WG16_9EURO|nr:L-lactate dehydrogenase (cytochrome) [Cladophialophora psammophila CBS 110553]EXJ63536.1 L-lactate dehydrogenase (cytochrome) [Cladophialophora psammophila CBS 110553]
MAQRKISVAEISSHSADTDCWIVVDNQVWDITKFAPEHPGGPGIIYKYAGRDATQAYNEIHSPAIIRNNLPADALKGVLDRSTITEEWSRPLPTETSKAKSGKSASSSNKPPLDSLINAHDYELAARNSATAKTWAFYSSAANDLITRDLNASLFNRVLFRPRVMRRVDKIHTETTILGHPVSFPLMISPAAMARLIHPDGELAIARAAKEKHIVQCISNNASYSASEIVSQPSVSSYPFFFQLYVNRERPKSEQLLRKIHQLKNVRAIFVTTDAAAAGKREADERVKADETIQNPMMTSKAKNDKKGGGYGRLMGSFIDPNLNWDDIAWLRSQTKLPLLLKGIMSADDVRLALDHGLEGVVLSNHGGRNLDTSPPALLVLLEIHARYPEIITQHHPASPAVRSGHSRPFSIFVDGGIRRGTDILKAVCLGAVSAGIGRPALFATGYGQDGVEQLLDILKDEFEVAMRNIGVTSLLECGPQYVNTGAIDELVVKTRDHPYAVSWAQDLRTAQRTSLFETGRESKL